MLTDTSMRLLHKYGNRPVQNFIQSIIVIMIKETRIDSITQTYHMFIFRHGKYTFFATHINWYGKFCYSGPECSCDIVDYYRNKLTLNMAGALLKWHTVYKKSYI